VSGPIDVRSKKAGYDVAYKIEALEAWHRCPCRGDRWDAACPLP